MTLVAIEMKIMRILRVRPELRRSEIRRRLGLSFAELDWGLKSLVEADIVAIHSGHNYVLTPSGILHFDGLDQTKKSSAEGAERQEHLF